MQKEAPISKVMLERTSFTSHFRKVRLGILVMFCCGQRNMDPRALATRRKHTFSKCRQRISTWNLPGAMDNCEGWWETTVMRMLTIGLLLLIMMHRYFNHFLSTMKLKSQLRLLRKFYLLYFIWKRFESRYSTCFREGKKS